MAFGIGGGELATLIASAGHHAGAHRPRLTVEAERLQCSSGLGHARLWHIGNQQVLPHRQAQRARAKTLGNIGNAMHLRHLQARRRNWHTQPDQSRLALGMHADMGIAPLRRARLALRQRDAPQWLRQQRLDLLQGPVQPVRIDHILHAGTPPVGAITMLDEHLEHRLRHIQTLRRCDQHTEIACEIAVASDATEGNPESDLATLPLPHCAKADVIGVLQRGHLSATIERDIEFSRQAIQLAMIEDEVVQCAAQGARIE